MTARHGADARAAVGDARASRDPAARASARSGWRARYRALALAAVFAALLGAGCGDGEPRTGGPGSSDRPGGSPPPNVLLITLDTLRPDRMGLYGHERDTTPRLDAFAADAVVFDNAFANSSFTPPSHASILTSRFPAEHGLMHWSQRLCDVPTAADLFAAAGYRTLAITPLRTLFAVGLGRGFETTLEPPHREGDGLIYLADAEAINADVLPELTAGDDARPFFAWLHYYDAHRVFARQGESWARRYNDTHDMSVGATERWYQLRPEPWKGKYPQRKLTPDDIGFMIDRYDGGLAYLDTQLGALFDALEAADVLDDTLVLITADHGEVFAEHDEEWFSHDPHLVDENVRVPLIVRLPRGARGGVRVGEPVQGVDVLPTLLELAGVEPADDDWRPAGLSLASTFDGGRLPRDGLFADRQGADWTGREDKTPEQVLAERDRKRMLRTPTHKLIVHDDRRTVSLFADGDEHTNLWDPADPVSQRMYGLFESLRAAQDECVSSAAPMDAAMQEHLRQLGYVGAPDIGDLQAEAEGDGR